MQAKHLFALSAFVLAAGTAAAQTVPAEAWVGAPITTAHAASRTNVTADLQRSARTAAATAEAWVGTQASAGIVAGTLSRAEVQATRPAALVIAFNMVVALLLVHTSQFFALTKSGGWALELQAFYLLTALVIALLGAGPLRVGKPATRWWQ